MDKREQLSKVIDGIINDDPAMSRAAFDAYVTVKARDVLGYSQQPAVTVPEPTAAVAEAISGERIMEELANRFNDMVDADNNIKLLPNNKISVNGKVVGSIKVDLTDLDSGIDFIDAENNFSKEFNTTEELFKFVRERYLGEK